MSQPRLLLSALSLAVLVASAGLIGWSSGLFESRAARLASLQIQYRELAAALGHDCPIAAPEDLAALEHCRRALFGDSALRRQLPEVLLWGRARGLPLKESPLTQMAPDVYAGLYAPLFMFEGTASLRYDETEKAYVASLPVRFRNRLPPGQFPYPFWHDKAKWSTYQAVVALDFYLQPRSGRIRVAQFRAPPIDPALAAEAERQAQAFDGQWLWTDGDGRTQPQVTLFDGLYSPGNPHLAAIDTAYRALAIQMREGQCQECHVPDNPNRMKELVLLQTPAHAAGEIRRVLHAVRRGEMPTDKDGHEKPLPPAVKASLLASAEAFEAVLVQARDWERLQGAGR